MDIGSIRNVAVIGPHGVGKTTLVEALLYDMAVIPARGRVAAGTTATDFDGEEIARELTLGTGVARGEYKGLEITLLDTPGHGDFLADARTALAAADAALLVVSADKGVDPNVRKVFRLAREAGLPTMIFLNGFDQEGAKDYGELLASVREGLATQAVPLELPVGRGRTFKGDVDLVGMRTWYFAPESGEPKEVQEPLDDEARRYHTQLVEAIAEQHDELLERYLDGQEPDPDELARTIRADMHAGKVIPVLLGSAALNVAIRPLLDAIATLFPSPLDRAYPELEDAETGHKVQLQPDAGSPAVATVFKTFVDPYLGKINVLRVMRGTITGDSHLTTVRDGETERPGRLFKLVGKKPMAVERLGPGEIGAVAKLKSVRTGDTLVAAGHPTRLLRFPMPVPAPAIWSIAIAPVAKQDEAKLAVSLAKLHEEDPTLEIAVEPRTHRTILTGAGPLHLEVVLARLQNRYNVLVSRGEPQVPYRETITGSAKAQGRHKKQTGGKGQFGDVWLAIEPTPRGTGFKFVDHVVGGAVPRNFIPAVEKGVRESLDMGLLAGYPIVDVQVTLYDGSSHSVDSSEMAFKLAAHLAMRKIFEEAGPVLLEPVMDIALTVPDEAVGDAMGDLSTRRGHIEGVDGGVVHAKLPLAELAGLLANVQGYTRGQATIESTFAGYQEVPLHLAQKLLDRLKSDLMGQSA
ncbi:MAG: fusA [Cyanobacteria bacterium RYN_339]|nr:fusA [Cyanobacteria bacterium RYN_339]